MKNPSFYFIRLILCTILIVASSNAVADKQADLIKAMQSPGHILMMRHENAPGYGDPDNIKIDDCSTQRNLDDVGRENSRKFGDWLRSNNIQADSVYSSQWCRCLETARLLQMGEVQELTALNSFFQMPETRAPNLNALRKFISNLPTDNKLTIMVTHYVTVQAITGQGLASGDAVLVKLDGKGGYETVGIVSSK